MSELLIKGGTVVDGTGAPGLRADVLVADGRIKEVGAHLGTTGQVIDTTGLVVAPGIIDPHTHMDGQLFFEPTGTPSSWHGVTTVVTGLCGFTFAPCRPEFRDYILRMFCRVEEMPLEVLKIGIPWSWVTFGEYLDALDHGLGVNSAAFVGHSTLRYHVVGPEAVERPSTPEEIRTMRQVLRESIEAGAFGLTTSRSSTNVDWEFRPVASRLATPEELVQLAEELRGLGGTSLQYAAEGRLDGLTEGDKELILRMASAARKPIQLGVAALRSPEFLEAGREMGSSFYATSSNQPGYRYINLHQGTNTFNSMDTWREGMEKPLEERLRFFADPALRPRLRQEVDLEATLDPNARLRPKLHWDSIIVARTAREGNRPVEGQSIAELAGRQGKHVVDVLLDLVVGEDLRTVLLNRFGSESAHFSEARAAMLRHPAVVPMNTDAGAHLRSECKAGDGTYFLRRWVIDHRILSLEEGVRRLTSLPAAMLGLTDRGVIRPGAAADIVVFDPQLIDSLDKEPVSDLPGGEERWIQRATGIQYVLVNGRLTIREGKETGELPGRVLRSGWYR